MTTTLTRRPSTGLRALLSRDPFRALAFGQVAPAITSMMVGGRWIGTPGRFRDVVDSDAYRGAHEEASERLANLLGRITPHRG